MRSGGAMKKYFLIPFAMLLCLIACDSGQKGLSQLFPGPGFQKGWSWYGLPQKISKEKILEITDISGDLFLHYGFQQGAACTYFFGRKDQMAFTVMVMKMGNPLNAFGIYTQQRGVQSKADTIGTEAFISDSMIRFSQGSYYVELRTEHPSDDLAKAMFTVALSLEKRIDEESSYPEITKLLPEEGLVPGSIQYFPDGMFGLERFPQGITGEYSMTGGENARALIAVFASSDQARTGMRSLLNESRRSGGRVTTLSGMSWGTAVSWPKKEEFLLVEQAGHIIFGVHNVHSAWRGIELFQRLKTHLSDSKGTQ